MSENHVLFTAAIKNTSTNDVIIRSAFVDDYKTPVINPPLDPNIGWTLHAGDTKIITVDQNIGQITPGQINLTFIVAANADRSDFLGYANFSV